MEMKIKKPIFITGVGRSGSSIFHKIFCEHPNVAWLSALCDKYVDKPAMNRSLMKVIDFPVVGNYLRHKYIPAECYEFWEHHCKGFRRPCRDLFCEDVTNKTRGHIQEAMSAMLTPRRNRLLIKITGWPRIGFLHEIFNDAKFIHIVRDGRAVVNSMININWWWGWGGPQNWRWGELTPDQKEIWETYNKSFIALAAIEWNILLAATERAKKSVADNDFLEIKYEDLCSDPMGTFREVIAFCELEWSLRFEDTIKKYPLKNSNHKWYEELTVYQQKMIEDIMHNYMKKYGYL